MVGGEELFLSRQCPVNGGAEMGFWHIDRARRIVVRELLNDADMLILHLGHFCCRIHGTKISVNMP